MMRKHRNSIVTRYVWIVLILFLPFVANAQREPDTQTINRLLQSTKADTATIGVLKRTAEFFLDKPGSYPADIAQAHRFAARIEVLSLQMNYLEGIGISKLVHAKAYREAGEAAKGRQISEEAVALFNAHGSPDLQAQALIELGGSYANTKEDLPRKISLYEQGAAIYQRMGKKLSEAQLKEFIGELLQLDDQNERSLRVLNEALAIYEQSGYTRVHGLYSVMGETYHRLNDFVQSLRCNLKAVEVGEKLKEEGPLLTTVYNRVGLNYYSIQYYDQAIGYFEKALAHAGAAKDTSGIVTMLINIADAFRSKGMYRRSLDSLIVSEQYGQAGSDFEKILRQMVFLKDYLALKDYRSAEKYFNSLADTYAKQQMSVASTQIVRLALILYLQKTGRYKETVPLLNAFNHDKELAPLPLNRRADAEHLLFKTDSALGHLPAAIQHYQVYKTLSDSLTSISQARQLGVLQLQFETQQKDKNIELLTQKSKLQEVSLQEERTFRNVFVVGVGMLLIFSALMYNRYRLKKRSNMELENKQKEINEQNQVLKKLVDEKEWLLKEVHHRVKNNLQIVISLLNTQSEYLNNADAIAAIRNSQHRMYAMSLIHQRLYQVENLGKIDMEWYVRELISYMKDSFECTDKIQFVVNTTSLCLDSAQAVPVGLIINEAVTNAIKYAFPGGRQGCIEVSLLPVAAGNCLIRISDNGVGLPEGYDVTCSASLGMSLMHGLADQLEASLNITSGDKGVRITLDFRCRFLNSDTGEIG